MARNADDVPAQAVNVGLLELGETGSKAANGRNSESEVNNLLSKSRYGEGVIGDPCDFMLTELQRAAKYGRVCELPELLAREEVVKGMGVEDERGETALHLAAKGGHHEIVKQLIEKCDPDARASFVNHRSHYSKPERRGDEDSSESMLLELGFCHIIYIPKLSSEATRPEADTNSHRTALHYASEGGHVETVKYLISTREVDVRLADREGNTALHLAITENDDSGNDGMDVLKELLAAKKVDLNREGSLGDTPLHKAVRIGNIDAVELLCEQRRLIATKSNHDGSTPLRLAWELQQNSSNKDTWEIIKRTLLERDEVQRVEEQFKSEREFLCMAVNALLVGGTLLASITYGGILEMPTLPPENQFVLLTRPTISAEGTHTPAQEDDYKARQRLYVRVIDLFRGSNNMCFFLAIVTLMLAIQVPISRRRRKVHVYIEEELEHLRTRSVLVSFCFTLSTFCAGVAFVTGGLAKVPVSESGWSLVLSRWVRRKWKLLFQSTMLTTDLSMGFVLFLILAYTISNDYNFILRHQVSKRISLQSLTTFLFSVLLFGLLLAVIVLLIVGSGLFQQYSNSDDDP